MIRFDSQRAQPALASSPVQLGAALLLLLGLSLGMSVPAHSKTTPADPAQKRQKTQGQQPAQGGLKVNLAKAELVRSLGGISEYRLPNGLQVLLFPDASKPTTTVNITYKVGSRHEGPGEAGMAHLLEHMLFKGSPEFKDIPQEFSRRGMRFNGTTTVDRTNYFSSFNASDDTLQFALNLEANRMLRSSILKSELDKEMTVVRNELEIGENNPGQLLQQRVMGLAFRFHPYGKPTIGTRSDVENVPIEKLQSFYRQYYQPDNAVLMIAGQMDTAKTLTWVEQAFGGLPKPTRTLRESYTVEPPQDGERALQLRRVGGAPMLMALYHVPGMAHPDCAGLSVLGQLLAQQPSGSLYKQLVESKQAVAVFAGGCGGYDPGVFTVGAVLPPAADASAVELALLKGVEVPANTSFKAEDVQRIAAQYELGYRQILKSPEAAVGLLSESVAAGDWRLIFKLIENVRTIKTEDVARIAQLYLQPANRSMGSYTPVEQPIKVEVPRVSDRSAGLDDLKMDQVISAGESFDPTPTALEARTRRLVMPSGIKLAVLPKKNRGDTVTVSMNLRWADARGVALAEEAGWVSTLLFEGTAKHSRQALIDESVKLKGGFNISGGGQGASVSVQAEKSTLIPLLGLVAEVLREPTFPAEAFERIKAQSLASFEAGAKEPQTLRAELTQPYYNAQLGLKPGDPGYAFSRSENLARLQGVSLEAIKAFYQRYWSANEMEIAVVGDLPDGLDVALDRLFGDWKKPTAPAYERWLDEYKAVAPARFDAQAKDKANAIVELRQEIRLNNRSADYPLLDLANHMLGGGAMESRLAKRVRQTEGLSYGMGSSVNVGYWDDASTWSIHASFAPENRERLLAATRDEIAKVLKSGFTQDELDRARNDVLQARRQSRSDDGALAGALLNQLETQTAWQRFEQGDQRRREATLEQVNAVLRKYLLPEAWVISTAGDFLAKPPLAAEPAQATTKP
ncbi:M16 family metallopeptidase [Roseateles koreensis]|uniref:Pitrilysin family protein n=1 Tax=Roseateles koreensis TaxID=2987526 RepID=A0ABT5KX60_9BURK|nr:pitrilysin family protein [Roseateles koreensis]MDC8786980.1 pitrilysin family protein [Roseateles koreensis]